MAWKQECQVFFRNFSKGGHFGLSLLEGGEINYPLSYCKFT